MAEQDNIWVILLSIFQFIWLTETFEDKRKENFDKGQAELEKRRAQLQEQLKKQEEERLAHERAEQEKQERIR